jgi:glycosyltransferase involved in cell wall biosynthesis
VTVVVCTLRRPEELSACLVSIRGLRTAPAELIVVNNDPADAATRRVAQSAGARVVDEPRRGLSAARNAGIAAAGGELVAFIDDDCRVEPHWLDELGGEFADPLVLACVGYVGPAELATAAQWLFEAQGGFERRVSHAVADGAVEGAWAAAGLGDGNAVFRRAAFERYGGFAEDLGPGTPARSAQDAELFYRLASRGHRVAFSPARVAWHRHRTELRPLAATLEGYTTGLAAHAARALAHHHDPAALRLWHWWGRHYFPRLARAALRQPRSGQALLVAVQARGAVAGPWRDRHARRRRAAPPPVPPPRSRPQAPARADACVVGELPAVAVVLASRNRRDSLLRALRALAGQDRDAEIVLVLDGSTDGSAEAVRSAVLPWPVHIVEQPPTGLASARNRGIAAATRPLILLLDDDIEAAPGLVTAHARAHAGRAEAIVMGHHPPVGRRALVVGAAGPGLVDGPLHAHAAAGLAAELRGLRRRQLLPAAGHRRPARRLRRGVQRRAAPGLGARAPRAGSGRRAAHGRRRPGRAPRRRDVRRRTAGGTPGGSLRRRAHPSSPAGGGPAAAVAAAPRAAGRRHAQAPPATGGSGSRWSARARRRGRAGRGRAS